MQRAVSHLPTLFRGDLARGANIPTVQKSEGTQSRHRVQIAKLETERTRLEPHPVRLAAE